VKQCTKLVEQLIALLRHTQSVQDDVIKLSSESTMIFTNIVQNSNISVDDTYIEAVQYQDIISQQLSATIDAINSTIKTLQNDNDLEVVGNNIAECISVAKVKKEAFSGKLLDNAQQDEIDFF